MSAYTDDPGLLAEFERNLPALEKFLRANGAAVTLRIDRIEQDGQAVTLQNEKSRGAKPALDPRTIQEMRKRLGTH